MRPLLGTLVEIRAYGPASCVTAGVAAAFSAIERVQRLMSFHECSSDVSRINSAPVRRKIKVSRETYEVLYFARELSHRSGGVFDVTIAPSLVSAGFLPHPPPGGPSPEPPSGAGSASYDDLELASASVVRWRKKAWIDLGGIAKGYAVDTAIEALRAHRIEHGSVNAGGDLRCVGDRVPIHLRSPKSPNTGLISIGWLQDAAIATSASYFSGTDEGSHRIDPIVDPRLGRCIAWAASISVAAAHCMTADALTKVVQLAPAASLPALLEHYNAQAVIVDRLGVRVRGQDWLHCAGGVSQPCVGKVAVR